MTCADECEFDQERHDRDHVAPIRGCEWCVVDYRSYCVNPDRHPCPVRVRTYSGIMFCPVCIEPDQRSEEDL